MAIFGNFWKTSETVQKCFPMFFYDFLKFLENLWKCSEMFGNFRKTSETVQNSKVICRCFYDFLKFPENFRKCLEMFGKFPDVSENVRNGLQESKSFRAGF